MKIVLAYDGSESAKFALSDLTRAALPPAGQAIIVCVADVLSPGTEWPSLAERSVAPEHVRRAWDFAEAEIAKAHRVAEEGAAAFKALFPAWEVRPVGVGDSPAWGVLRQAEEFGVDLIVAGSHGFGPLQRLFLGSVSLKLLAEAPCSVRIKRPSPQGMDPLVVIAIDGSPDTDAVIEAVKARVWPAGTRFVILSVIDSQLLSAGMAKHTGVGWLSESQLAEDGAHGMAENYAASLRLGGWPVTVQVSRGSAKEIILSTAEHLRAESLFLGAHGLQHGLQRTLGTVASAVAARAHCPVEVVRARRVRE